MRFDINMHYLRAFGVMLVILETAFPNVEIRRAGWLDRVVQYHKAKFVNEMKEYAPIQIKVNVIQAPKGYKDSKAWNFDSVMHLIVLIKRSEAAAPLYRALRGALKPTRRLMMSIKDSFKYFPSLSKASLNEFYYDVGSVEDYPDEQTINDTGVIVVSNPVEARLPSGQISVSLLKEILTQRALAARAMPSTTTTKIPWITKNNTQDKDDDKKPDEKGEEGNSTTDSGVTSADGATDAGAEPEAGGSTPEEAPETAEPEA